MKLEDKGKVSLIGLPQVVKSHLGSKNLDSVGIIFKNVCITLKVNGSIA